MIIIGKLFLRKQKSASRQPCIPVHFIGTSLNEQMEFAIRATQRLASHLNKCIDNTVKEWSDSSDGFYTIYVHGRQTIEDPELFELLVEILPSITAMHDESKAAVQLLRQSVKTKFMAENLRMHTIKGCIKDGIFELNIRHPSYSCILYQIIYRDPYPPTLRVVTITPEQSQLIIQDYSQALTQKEALPLLEVLAATRRKGLTIDKSKPYFEAIHQCIQGMEQGYQTYTLDFPSMELVA